MKYLKLLVLIIIVVGIFLACDDDPVMDLAFPQPGYLWIAFNSEWGEDWSSRLEKWSFTSEYPDEFYRMPFIDDGIGGAYDTACGNGKVWVTGLVGTPPYDMDYIIWEAISDEESGPFRYCQGLTYDGEMLWGGDTETEESNVITDFYNIDPTSYDETEVFTYTTTVKKYLRGLAWSDAGLWSVFSKPTPPPEQPDLRSEFILFDPETGEDIYHIDCSVEYPVGLAWDGEALWTNDKYTGRTYRVDPKNGEVLGYIDIYSTNHHPWGLCFEATGTR